MSLARKHLEVSGRGLKFRLGSIHPFNSGFVSVRLQMVEAMLLAAKCRDLGRTGCVTEHDTASRFGRPTVDAVFG